MIFAMAELPGEFTTFDFIEGIPAPFNFGLAILLNQNMLTLAEKLQCAPALLPMLVEGQDFIDQQDELSVLEFMRKYAEYVFIEKYILYEFIYTPHKPTERERECQIHAHACTEERQRKRHSGIHVCVYE